MKRTTPFLLASALLTAILFVGCTPVTRTPKSIEHAMPTEWRVEPLCWWTDMQLPLQIMVHGDGVGSATEVRAEGLRGVSVHAVHPAESPNYLFVDVAIGKKAVAGTFSLLLTLGDSTVSIPYTLYERGEGSRQRASFGTADMIYLLMPDRFANGDPTNDTTPLTAEAAHRAEAFGRHGGDLQGIIDHLDYIADLGATAVWSTPLLLDDEPTVSYHGYACADYYHVDPRFGTNDLYRDYVARAHALGLKVVMDFVPNHCGAAHWWMADLPFADWVHQFPSYTKTNVCFSSVMDPNASRRDRSLQESGWFDTAMPDMNLDNPFLLHYMQQVAIWWTEWSGQDGIRIDTFPYNEAAPAAALCAAITDEYPNLNIVGEVWTPSIPQLAYWQGGNDNRDGYDSHLPSIMDFPLKDALVTAITEDAPGWGEGTTRIYDVLSHDFVYHNLSHMMIFAANHDTWRLGDIVQGDVRRMKLLTALLATLRGYPQTFSGDEMMFRASDASYSDGAKRVDFPGGWSDDAVSLFTPEGRSAEQQDLYDYNRRLWQWRRHSLAVQQGRTLHFLSRDNTYAYFRYLEQGSDVSEAVFVFINNSPEDQPVPWSHYDEFTPRLAGCCATDVLTGQPLQLTDSTLVAAESALVVEFKRPIQ